MKITTILLLLVIQINVFSQNLEKAFRYLNEGDNYEALTLFQNIVEQENNSAAYYGITKCMLAQEHTLNVLFDALFQIEKADNYYYLLSPQEISKYLNYDLLLQTRFTTDSLLTQSLISYGDSASLMYYLKYYYTSEFYTSVLSCYKEQFEIERDTIFETNNNSTDLFTRRTATWHPDTRNLFLNNPQDIFLCGKKDIRSVALTFDDVPDAIYTPQLLDSLKKYGVKATFFIVGKQAKKHPEIVKRMYNEGHLLANHTYTHARLTAISPLAIKQEISSTENEIYKIIHKRTALFRPPFGSIDQREIDLLKTMNYKTIYWSLDTYDWRNSTAQVIFTVKRQIAPNDIVLMHRWQVTLESIGTIIRECRENNLQMVTLDVLLGMEGYKK